MKRSAAAIAAVIVLAMGFNLFTAHIWPGYPVVYCAMQRLTSTGIVGQLQHVVLLAAGVVFIVASLGKGKPDWRLFGICAMVGLVPMLATEIFWVPGGCTGS